MTLYILARWNLRINCSNVEECLCQHNFLLWNCVFFYVKGFQLALLFRVRGWIAAKWRNVCAPSTGCSNISQNVKLEIENIESKILNIKYNLLKLRNVCVNRSFQTFHCSNFPKWALHIHLYIMLDSGHSTFKCLKQKTRADKIGFSNMLDLPPLSTGRIPIYLGGSGEQFSCLVSFRICLHWRQPQYIFPDKYPPTNIYYKYPIHWKHF